MPRYRNRRKKLKRRKTAGCYGNKKNYPTKEIARRARKRQNVHLRIYWCASCKAYHMTKRL